MWSGDTTVILYFLVYLICGGNYFSLFHDAKTMQCSFPFDALVVRTPINISSDNSNFGLLGHVYFPCYPRCD
jgi:hypothetical protein